VRQVRGFHRRSGWRISADGDYDTPKLMLEFEDCWGQCQQPSPDIEVGGWATEVREEEGRERQGRRGGRISEIKRLRKEEQERKGEGVMQSLYGTTGVDRGFFNTVSYHTRDVGK
jgi:hypothetical protein